MIRFFFGGSILSTLLIGATAVGEEIGIVSPHNSGWLGGLFAFMAMVLLWGFRFIAQRASEGWQEIGRDVKDIKEAVYGGPKGEGINYRVDDHEERIERLETNEARRLYGSKE